MNYPIVGHIRFLLEAVRPEIRQYFAESDTDAQPFSRQPERTLAFERAKKTNDKFPFGTELDVNAASFEWINHSIAPRPVATEPFRTTVGGPGRLPAVFDFGPEHIRHELRRAERQCDSRAQFGPHRGAFAHDTGEGGFSRHHRQHGGDIILQIASGYFGCRTPDGRFSPSGSPNWRTRHRSR